MRWSQNATTSQYPALPRLPLRPPTGYVTPQGFVSRLGEDPATRSSRAQGDVGESALPLEILGRIANPQAIARGTAIRELRRILRVYGPGRWRKMKGIARVRLPDGSVSLAEVHWYQAHGIGRREFKIKQLLDGHDVESL